MNRRLTITLLSAAGLSLLGAGLPAVGLEAPPLPPMPLAVPAGAGSVEAPGGTPRSRGGAVPAATVLPAGGAGQGQRQTAATTSTRQIVLELGRRTISLVEDGKVLGSWPVAIGDPTTPTPTGTFAVRNKVVNPQYQSTKSGKNNPTIGPQGPLGDRWIGFHSTSKDQFGIHGTPSAWSWTVTSRAAVTHGCVRMLTPHVRALFEQVDVGTPVIVKR